MPRASSLPLRARTIAVLLAVGILAAAVLAAQSPPAGAGARPERWEGRSASADWVEPSAIHNQFGYWGNYHIGTLYASQSTSGRAWVEVFIADFECPDGVTPGHWFEVAHEPPTGPQCDHLGYRTGFAEDQAFTIDNRLRRATLKGKVDLYASDGGGHDGEAEFFEERGTFAGSPSFEMTWTGTGKLRRGMYMDRFHVGNQQDFYRSRYTSRDATVGGILGPMPFVPARSSGALAQDRSMYRFSSWD